MNMQEDAGPPTRFYSEKDNEDDDSEFVEVDPTRQYGRYKEILGKGAFKTVYKGFDEVNGMEVAWNQVKVEDVVRSPEDLERLYSEVHLLKTLKHKNIIKLYSSWVDTKTENVNFITEIFTSGTLRQYRKKHKHVDLKAIKNWARQILRGLLYLHSHDPPIIHRDLKCDNIFVNGNQGEVKIGDLGLAAILRQANAAHSVIGTPEFMAPELYEEEYNELVDIYSFGMCVLEMVTAEYPYSECTNAAQIYKKVTSGKKPAALQRVKDPEMRAFVEKCLTAAPYRLPARELLMDPFLQCDLDTKALGPLPLRRLHFRGDDMGELGIFMGEHLRSISTKGGPGLDRLIPISSEITDKEGMSRPAVLDRTSMPFLGDAEVIEKLLESSEFMQFSKGSSFSSLREEIPSRSGEITIKGKRRDDDTIYLRLRISNHEGCFRNIHFPFDVEADTALCVASEMVAELDLSDHDVTTIAEMIDAEIVALVPDWKPGAAFDESVAVDCENPSDLAVGSMTFQVEYDRMETTSSDESVLEPLPSSHGSYLHSLKFTSLEVASPLGESTTLHGRFEEVSYVFGASDRSFQSYPSFSSDSCDVHDTGDGENFEDVLSYPATPDSGARGAAKFGLPESGRTRSKARIDQSGVENKQKTAMMQDNPSPELHTSHGREYPAMEEFSDCVLRESKEEGEWLCVLGPLGTEGLVAVNKFVGKEAKGEHISDLANNLVQNQFVEDIDQRDTPKEYHQELGSNQSVIYSLSSTWVHPDGEDSGSSVSHVAAKSSISGDLSQTIKAPISDTSLSKTALVESSGSTGSPKLSTVISDKEKSESVLHIKRDYFTQYYKTGRMDRSKVFVDAKTEEASHTRELCPQASTLKSGAVEQQKKEQLQKSIADLEAKTLQGLRSSKNSYLASVSKKFVA
ncbi:hypothetical protein O6H91_11G084800 [Diphasiastrum complanatum]|uniref:Uncharacterized protein n=1 Tax=Diphasiastrum complanatum TaxID=34168 RepID=A0ACC2CB82_DIPCM|nr:hypothetical protein O6H91_11G084800 [Diphasiastrum complanatum]